jgi:hypothetical protein
MRRGWDDRAIWSIDMHLAELIPQLMRRLKVKDVGIPASMFEECDWDEEKHEYKEGKFEQAIAKWEGILDEIAEGFEEYERLTYDVCERKALESEKFHRAFDLLREYWGNFWI